MSKKTAISRKSESHLVVFQEKAIRRTWHNEEWWFAIVDVVAVLTDSVQPEGYVKDLRHRDKELAKGWGEIATPFGLKPNTGQRGRVLQCHIWQNRRTACHLASESEEGTAI